MENRMGKAIKYKRRLLGYSQQELGDMHWLAGTAARWESAAFLQWRGAAVPDRARSIVQSQTPQKAWRRGHRSSSVFPVQTSRGAENIPELQRQWPAEKKGPAAGTDP